MRGRLQPSVLLASLCLVLLAVWLGLAVVHVAPFTRASARLSLACFAFALAAWALARWLTARAALAGAAAAHERAQAAEKEAEEARAGAAEAAAEAERARDERTRAVGDQTRAHAALRREREWNRELRAQVVQLHRQWGSGAPTDDVRALVLRVAVELTESRRGLLLSMDDQDGDGHLELVASQGFAHDPAHSELADRFAKRVMERDAIVREDRPGDGEAAADDEIHTLLAIPVYLQDDFAGVVVCADRDGGYAELDDEVLLSLGDHAGAVLQNASLHGRLRDAYVGTVRLLAEALQAKDPFLRGHSEDVAELVDAVAERLELEPPRRERLRFASLLHDVGKLGISERILLKPAALTPEERAIVMLHPRIGLRLVEQVPGMAELGPAILHHHERWDGTGYPARLKGEAIPLEARVVCVADSYSAMTEQRPYRERVSSDEACSELERCAGSQFDPRVVRLFVEQVRGATAPVGPSPMATALSDAELLAALGDHEPVLGLEAASLTDGLTLLYSLRYFHEAAEAEAERAALQAAPFAIVLLLLSGLQEVNRRFGYAAGDEALRRHARALSRVAVHHGAVACRVGGAQLGLVCPRAGAPTAEALAAEVRTALEAVEDVSPGIDLRVAVAVWEEGERGSDVVDRARRALAPSVAE